MSTAAERRAGWVLMGGLVGALLVAFLLSWMHGQCFTPAFKDATKTSGDFGCTEFWFSRYQTFIGGLFALAAAGVAWRIGAQQLRFNRRQLLPSNRTVMMDVAKELGDQADRARKISDCLGVIAIHLKRIPELSSWDIEEVVIGIETGFDEFRDYVTTIPASTRSDEQMSARVITGTKLHDLTIELSGLARLLRSIATHPRDSTRRAVDWAFHKSDIDERAKTAHSNAEAANRHVREEYKWFTERRFAANKMVFEIEQALLSET